MNLSDKANNDFVLVVVSGMLLLVVVVPALCKRLTARYGYRAPIQPNGPSRPARGNPADSLGIPCLHCPAHVQSFSEMDLHLKFDCPGLRRREQE